MPKSLVTLLGTLGLVSILAATGCPSSDGDGAPDGGGSGTYAATLAACNAYCDALFASCATPLIYPTVDQCKTTECSSLMFQTAGCYAAGKTMWDCRRVQPTICTALGCDAEFAAAVAACE